MFFNTFPLLSLLIWLPILGGFFILFFNSEKKSNVLFVKYFSLFVSIISLVLCFFLIKDFDSSFKGYQFVQKLKWLSILDVYYLLGVDGFSLPLIILTAFMTFLVLLSGLNSVSSKVSYYYSAFLIMQGLVSGMFCSLDSLLFYIFFESLLVPMFLIIGIWGGPNRVYATLKFFLYTFFGSIFLLGSILYLHFVCLESMGNFFSNSHDVTFLSNNFNNLFSQYNYQNDLVTSFSIPSFQVVGLTLYQQQWLFFAFLIAFAVKVPMWPVHTWLPDAHVEAPTGGSVILAAITLKIGGYGFLRFIMPIVPDACAFYGWVVVLLSLLAITYIGFVALVQEDLKKLIAYSSISHMGFVTLGLFLSFSLCATTRNIGEAAIGIEGAMIQMVSHGFISGALFFCVGIIYTQMKTRLIKDYGGVINKMPLYSTFLMFFVMSNSGLPGTSGFIGEFFVILCAFKVSFLYAFLASTSLILGAAYNLWMYKRVVFGNIKNSAVLLLRDIDYTDRAVLGLLAFFVLILGIWPQPLLTVMHSSTEVLLNQIVYSKV